MKKLRINKYDVIVFNLIRARDQVNGNTYTMFGECYIIRKGQRKYFSDMLSDQIWKPYKYEYSYGDMYDIAKSWINKNSNVEIRYLSDFQRLVCAEKWVTYKELKSYQR